MRVRSPFAVLLAAAVVAPAFAQQPVAQPPVTPVAAQSVMLAEAVKPGECFKYDLALTVTGKMKVDRGGRTAELPMTAEATHAFTDRIEAADAGGAAGKVVRHYAVAKSASSVGGEASKRELAADRRLTVAVRTEAGTLHFCPAGPFTRDDLELVGEHFDTLALPSLLPGKAVAVGDTWPLAANAAQHACQFDALAKNELVGTLTGVKDGVATFTLAGKAEGVDLGAAAKVSVTAAGTFDVASSRITSLTWEQDDDRDQGAASPATEVHAKVVLKRTALAEEPKELSAEARAKVPEGKAPADMLRLSHTDPDGRYTLAYPREWVIVGRTPDHLVLRALDKGQFAAQATITTWAKADAGKHTPADEFKATVAKLPQWEPTDVLADGERAGVAGKWVYQYAAKGKQDGTAVVQSFLLVAGPGGEQAAVTLLTTPEKAAKLADREAELLDGLTLTAKK